MVTCFYSRGKQGELPEGMPGEMLAYEWFADAYGWGSEQTDNERLDVLHWLPIIREAKAEVARMRSRDEQNKHKRPGR